MKTAMLPSEMQLTNEINLLLQECIVLVGQGIEQLCKAGQIIVKLRDQHALTHCDLAERLGSSLAIIDELERVGRGTMYGGLYFAFLPAKKALMGLPYADQERLMTGGTVEMVTVKSDGSVDTLQVDVKALNRNQVKRVFGRNRLLTIGEQRARLEAEKSQAAIAAPTKRQLPWEITKAKDLQVNFAQVITKRQFEQLAAQMGYTRAKGES